MSYSSQVKEELSKINNFKNKELLEAEFLGYILTGNANLNDEEIKFVTENEFNIERFYKILFALNIEYEPSKISKKFVASISKSYVDEILNKININEKSENIKTLIRGAFLSAGSITDPQKSYHLEILFLVEENARYIMKLCENFDIQIKIMEYNGKYMLYIKDAEEISKFLACIGANNAVLLLENIRIYKEMKNNVNRIVNCETANLNKTINAAIEQIEDIKFLKKINRFEDLSIELKELANLRLEHPESTLKELGEMLNSPIGKSGVNHRLKKIQSIAKEFK